MAGCAHFILFIIGSAAWFLLLTLRESWTLLNPITLETSLRPPNPGRHRWHILCDHIQVSWVPVFFFFLWLQKHASSFWVQRTYQIIFILLIRFWLNLHIFFIAAQNHITLSLKNQSFVIFRFQRNFSSYSILIRWHCDLLELALTAIKECVEAIIKFRRPCILKNCFTLSLFLDFGEQNSDQFIVVAVSDLVNCPEVDLCSFSIDKWLSFNKHDFNFENLLLHFLEILLFYVRVIDDSFPFGLFCVFND